MKIHLVMALSVMGLLTGCLAYAHDDSVAIQATYEALGAAEPRILPSSSLYFFKEWGRGIKLFLAFNAVAKAKVEADIASKKAAEIKALVEKEPQNEEALLRAIENYKTSVARAQARFSALSSNPNAAELLANLAERSAAHQSLFSDLQKKFADESNITAKTAEITEIIRGSAVPKTTPAAQNAAPQATPGVPAQPTSQKSGSGSDCPEVDAVAKKYQVYGMQLITDKAVSNAYYEELSAATGACLKRTFPAGIGR